MFVSSNVNLNPFAEEKFLFINTLLGWMDGGRGAGGEGVDGWQ
jgi:hypothetical protein